MPGLGHSSIIYCLLLLSFQSQESEPPYVSDDPEEADDNFRWSEQDHERQRLWVSGC